MPLWDKVKQELDRAGQVAQDAIDEGRIRLEAQRTRRLADRAAQTLGYAIHRARAAGAPLEESEIARHAAKIAEYDAETRRLEEQLATIQRRWRTAPGGAGSAGASSAGAATGTAAGAATGRPDPLDPTPAPPASATTAPPPETATAPQVVDATTDSSIDDDPWHPTDASRGPTSI
jgi:hypothetical protein